MVANIFEDFELPSRKFLATPLNYLQIKELTPDGLSVCRAKNYLQIQVIK